MDTITKPQSQTMAADRHAFQELFQLLAMGAVVGVAILWFTVMTWTEILLALPVMAGLLYILRIRPVTLPILAPASPPPEPSPTIVTATSNTETRCACDMNPAPRRCGLGLVDFVNTVIYLGLPLLMWVLWVIASPLKALAALAAFIFMLVLVFLGMKGSYEKRHGHAFFK